MFVFYFISAHWSTSLWTTTRVRQVKRASVDAYELSTVGLVTCLMPVWNNAKRNTKSLDVDNSLHLASITTGIPMNMVILGSSAPHSPANFLWWSLRVGKWQVFFTVQPAAFACTISGVAKARMCFFWTAGILVKTQYALFAAFSTFLKFVLMQFSVVGIHEQKASCTALHSILRLKRSCSCSFIALRQRRLRGTLTPQNFTVADKCIGASRPTKFDLKIWRRNACTAAVPAII